LFFDEVERERETLALKSKNRSVFAKIYDNTAGAIFALAKGLYGSSLTNEDVEELLGDGGGNQQGAAVVLAVGEEEGAEESTTESIAVVEPVEPEVLAEETIEEKVLITEEIVETGIVESVVEEDPAPQAPGLGDFLFPIPPGAGGGGGGGASVPAPQAPAQDTTAPDAPVINIPADFSQTFLTTGILFSGTAEATSMISTDFSSATTTAADAGDWSFVLSSFPQGTTTVQFFAIDAAGNTSQATSITFSVDSVVPDVTLSVSECASSFSTSGCIIATTTTNISWSSTASDLDYFVLDNGGIVSTTTATSTNTVIASNSSHTFSVSARDMAGNYSATTTETVISSTIPVAINEVAWMGTGASNSSDEWIELYNNTNSVISLDDWVLYAEDLTPYIPLSGTIGANEYYLIERTDDDTVSDITASLIYGNDGSSWALNNSSGEHLILARVSGGATTTIDEILKCSNWCGKGTTSGYKSMERKNSLISGTDWDNWGTALGEFIVKGKDVDSVALSATANGRNSATYEVFSGTTFSSDRTLTKASSPYLVGRYGFTVSSGTTLTIEAGTIIKIVSPNEPSITIHGSLISNGTPTEPVVFTALADDEYGGDMNGDGTCDPGNASSTASCPLPGSWKQVFFSNSSTGSLLDNTIIRYGGRWFNHQQFKSMVAVDSADVVFENSTFEYSDKHGLELRNSTSTVANSTFRGNNLTYDSCGISEFYGVSNINANQFINNKTGICAGDSAAVISSNTFTENTTAIKSLGWLGGSIRSNIGSGNGINGVVLQGVVTRQNATTTLMANTLPYVLNVNMVTAVSGSTLVIDPGVVLKFSGRELDIRGRLSVNGVSGNPVIFTSIGDDSDGNDASNDGASAGSVGGTQGVYMRSGATSDINNAEFRYMKIGTSYDNSPIDLENIIYDSNELGVSAASGETILKASNITFIGNVATSTIPLN